MKDIYTEGDISMVKASPFSETLVTVEDICETAIIPPITDPHTHRLLSLAEWGM